jgi:tRNA(Arg) A34 adenosine deaminase TadA
MNATNITRNGTRHAEFMAISALLSFSSESDDENAGYPDSAWDTVDSRGGHLYPYGQKLHPSPRFSHFLISECILYVTVEPCVMCASLLRQLGIKKVYFGAVNDKFGGTGGVFRIHMNSTRSTAASVPHQSTSLSSNGNGKAISTGHGADTSSCNRAFDGNLSPIDDKGSDASLPATLEGDGGNVEPGYEVEGGWGRDEAVILLRQFYVQENNRGE